MDDAKPHSFGFRTAALADPNKVTCNNATTNKVYFVTIDCFAKLKHLSMFIATRHLSLNPNRELAQ